MTEVTVKGLGTFRSKPYFSGYPDNSGTLFVPKDHGSVWIRQYSPPHKIRHLMRKKGRFGIWQTKYQYAAAIKWFGADKEETESGYE